MYLQYEHMYTCTNAINLFQKKESDDYKPNNFLQVQTKLTVLPLFGNVTWLKMLVLLYFW